ncbi:hypothetical protein L798_07443 [Zootermopsis nevadensis]|uniref:Uncharacterized protein n=1 Tax=Zootermopsis nevadensis TaxID=136037 RepID=A0A067R5I1_ZOONE|nr:hypothetical protein L798_07443 [Zootermopsis nevadensis]
MACVYDVTSERCSRCPSTRRSHSAWKQVSPEIVVLYQIGPEHTSIKLAEGESPLK